MIDYSKVKETDWLTRGVSEKQLQKEERLALKTISRMNKKTVKVICPKCGTRMIYKNYWSWVWHTPFHWFGKRRTKCSNCGEYSYMRRERNKR